MKTKISLLILLLMTPLAASQVTYDIQTDKNTTNLSTYVTLDCSIRCPQLNWKKPTGFSPINVTDSRGNSLDYDNREEEIVIQTGYPIRGDSKVIQINMHRGKEANEIYDGLYQQKVSLVGFKDQELSGTVEASGIISGDIGYGFRNRYDADQMNFTGTGFTSLTVNFGNGRETEHYVFFGDAPGRDTSEAYEISVGTTGQVQSYGRIPVAVIPGATYNRTQTSWSSGEYSSGTIRMRGDLEDDQFNPTLARETVHALNDRLLSWDQTSSSYIDEGTSEFVGYLMERRQIPVDQRQESVRQLFGESVRYDPDPNDRSYYRIPSNGDKETLWNYYQQDGEFMKNWSPGDSQYRSFGYAYSELIIRHNLVEKDMKLSELYQYFEHGEEVDDPEQKWSILSENLDLTPCKTDNRTRFNNCLERVNNHSNFQAYTADPERGEQKLVINKTETPEYNRTSEGSFFEGINSTETINGRETFGSFLQSIVQYISRTLNSFFR